MAKDPTPEEVTRTIEAMLVGGETLEFSYVYPRRTDNYCAVTSQRVIFPKLLRDGFEPASVPFRHISLLSHFEEGVLILGTFGSETLRPYDHDVARRLYESLITKMCA